MNSQDASNIVSEYLKPVFGFAVKRCRSVQDAEDLTQEIMLRTFRSLTVREDISDVPGFIWTVARNALCNYYRRAERKMRPAHPRENRRIKEKELPAAAPFYAPMSSRTKNADARNITVSAQSAAGMV